MQEVQEETAKETDADMSSRKLGIDHFDNEESNPIKSKAMNKYLLESFSIPLLFWLIYCP